MPFEQAANIEGNQKLRIPQRNGWLKIRDHFSQPDCASEVGIVLPVGCGKSGLISITPYAINAKRVLVIAPGIRIRKQLGNDLKANSSSNFYEKCKILASNDDFPEVVIVASNRANMDDIQNGDVIIANIQQIAGEENRWLDELVSVAESRFFVD